MSSRAPPVSRYKPPEGSPEGVPFSEASRRAKRGRPRAERSEAPPSEARLHQAKRGSTEAPPSEARPREGHREVAITKKLKKVPPESPGREPLIIKFSLLPGLYYFQKKTSYPWLGSWHVMAKERQVFFWSFFFSIYNRGIVAFRIRHSRLVAFPIPAFYSGFFENNTLSFWFLKLINFLRC